VRWGIIGQFRLEEYSMISKPAYVGDGVYIQHRPNGDVTLTTGCHLPQTPAEAHVGQPGNTIVLEPEVLIGAMNWLIMSDPTARSWFEAMRNRARWSEDA